MLDLNPDISLSNRENLFGSLNIWYFLNDRVSIILN
jgi:hypothetical protein